MGFNFVRTAVSMAMEMSVFLEETIAARIVLGVAKTSMFLSLLSVKWSDL